MHPEDPMLIKRTEEESKQEIKAHWRSIMFEGILFVILGIFALALPLGFSLAFEMVIGWLFLIGGVIQFYRALQSNQAHGYWMMIISSVFAMIFGVLLVFHPLQGLVALTAIMGIYFLAEGLVKVIFSFQIQQFANWGWMLLSGVCSIIISAIVFTGWPETAMWFIGTLVGVYLIINGVAFIMMSWKAHKEDVKD